MVPNLLKNQYQLFLGYVPLLLRLQYFQRVQTLLVTKYAVFCPSYGISVTQTYSGLCNGYTLKQ
jgi:hypothetical protein